MIQNFGTEAAEHAKKKNHIEHSLFSKKKKKKSVALCFFVKRSETNFFFFFLALACPRSIIKDSK